MLKPGDARKAHPQNWHTRLFSVALCTYTANYLERNNAWMQELIDAGLMLEAESHALNMCKHLLLFGVPYRYSFPHFQRSPFISGCFVRLETSFT